MSETQQKIQKDSSVDTTLRYVPEAFIADGGKSFAQQVLLSEAAKEKYSRYLYVNDEFFDIPKEDIAFNPYVASVVLETLEPSIFSHSRIITAETRGAALNDVHVFAQAVDSVLQKKPEKLLEMHEFASAILGDAGVTDVMERILAEKDDLVTLAYSFDKAVKLFPEGSDLQAALARKIVGVLENNSPVGLTTVFSRGAGRFFEPAEARAIIETSIMSSGTLTDNLNTVVEDGVIAADEMKQLLLKRYGELKKAGGYRNHAREIPDMLKSGVFTNPEDIQYLKEEFISAFRDEKNEATMPLYLLLDLPAGFIADEEITSIVGQRFNDDPTFSVHNLSWCLEYLPTEQVRAQAKELIGDKIDLDNKFFVEGMLEHETLLTAQEKEGLARVILMDEPQLFMKSFAEMIVHIPEDDRRQVVDELFAAHQAFDTSCIESINLWMPYISEDSVEQRAFLEGVMRERGTLDISMFISEVGYPENAYKGLFSRQEIIDLVYERLPANIENINAQIFRVKNVFTDSELRAFGDVLYDMEPRIFFDQLELVGYLYDNHEISEMVEQLIEEADAKSLQTLLTNITKWSVFVESSLVKQVVDTITNRAPAVAIRSIKYFNVATEGDTEYINALIDQVSVHNPVAVLENVDLIRKYTQSEVDEDTLIERGESDTDTIRFAPTALKKFYRRIKTTTDPNQRAILMTEASAIYTLINTMQQQGYGELYERVRSDASFSNKQEREVLDVFATLAVVNQSGLKTQLEGITNLSELKMHMLDATLSNLGLESVELSEVEKARFFDQLGTGSTSFMVYAARHASGVNRTLLQDMTTALLSDNYENWRMGLSTGLKEVQEAGILPQETTQDQYDQWNKQISLEDVDDESQTTLEDVALSIHELVTGELGKLGSSIDRERPLQEQLDALNALSPVYGKKVAELNNQKRAELEDGNLEKVAEIEAAIETIRSDLREAKRDIDLALLLSLTAQQVESGNVYDPIKGKETEPIHRLLQRLEDSLPEQAGYVIDDIRQLVAANSSESKVTVYETVDPTDTIEIGANPVGSCQHYAHGIFNQALISYTDPNVKIIMADRGDSHVGRAIIRVLSSSAGTPALYLEKAYFNDAAPSVKRSILAVASAKAQSMGIPLYVNKEDYISVARDGEELFETSVDILKSSGSRAANVYSDAAGGIQANGEFSLSGLSLVKL